MKQSTIPTTARKQFFLEPQQFDKPFSQWTPEQRRNGGAWAKHELQAKHDKLCAAYDWTPGWTQLSASEIYFQAQRFYDMP